MTNLFIISRRSNVDLFFDLTLPDGLINFLIAFSVFSPISSNPIILIYRDVSGIEFLPLIRFNASSSIEFL
ncbi:MAG: hypothetical protein PHQ76_06590 [Caldisericia bacterium]|nr:hypothetical protein [Caldisericia bacterium]